MNNEYGVIELTILIEREFSKSGSEGTGTHKGNRRRMLICVMQGVFSQFPETRSCPITFYVLDGLGVTSQTFLVIDGSFTILVISISWLMVVIVEKSAVATHSSLQQPLVWGAMLLDHCISPIRLVSRER